MMQAFQRKIQRKLKKSGVRNTELLEEMTDHYLTLLEQKLEQGQHLAKAKQEVLTEIEQHDYKDMNRQIFFIHYKNHLIMSTLSIILVGMLTFTNVSQPTPPPLANFFIYADPPSIWPIEATRASISSGFGQRKHPILKTFRHHNGIDFKAKLGTPILAPANGVVQETGEDNGHGKYIVIKHDDIYTTRYHHLSEIKVEKGQEIKQGSTIGLVGSTGRSTAPHLHYEVLENGKHVNPEKFLKP
ncbi:MAG: M23 family metallopeptidase [Saprospiraceae bacterium]|nr:M23 family metallopeptidase [Saprospiraceae bacterium]